MHLSEGVFGGYELTLKIAVANIYYSLEIKMTELSIWERWNGIINKYFNGIR